MGLLAERFSSLHASSRCQNADKVSGVRRPTGIGADTRFMSNRDASMRTFVHHAAKPTRGTLLAV
jgi:hypothetical protein